MERHRSGTLPRWALLLAATCACDSPVVGPAPAGCDTLPVEGVYATFRIPPAPPDRPEQRFWASITSAAGILSALDAWQGRSSANIPAGDLVCEPAAWNCGWPWHQDPATVVLAEMAIEVCDGMPPPTTEACLTFRAGSGGGFCPWSAELVELRDCRTDPSCPAVPR